MATVQKRTLVNLPEDVKTALDILAKKKKKSVSKTAAELLEFALNFQEDIYLDELANERMKKSFKTISHKNIWK